MSDWKNIKKDDIEVDDEDLNIFYEQDDFGARYAIIKIKDLLDILMSSKIIKKCDIINKS